MHIRGDAWSRFGSDHPSFAVHLLARTGILRAANSQQYDDQTTFARWTVESRGILVKRFGVSFRYTVIPHRLRRPDLPITYSTLFLDIVVYLPLHPLSVPLHEPK